MGRVVIVAVCFAVPGLLFLILSTGVPSDGATEAGDTKVPIVINMTAGADDLHSVWMGLQLASHGLADGRNVVVYMNVHAAPLATKKTPADLRFKEMPTVREQISGILDKGGRVIVCPGCMKVGGFTKEDLLEGVEVSSKDALFDPLDQNAAVFSY